MLQYNLALNSTKVIIRIQNPFWGFVKPQRSVTDGPSDRKRDLNLNRSNIIIASAFLLFVQKGQVTGSHLMRKFFIVCVCPIYPYALLKF